MTSQLGLPFGIVLWPSAQNSQPFVAHQQKLEWVKNNFFSLPPSPPSARIPKVVFGRWSSKSWEYEKDKRTYLFSFFYEEKKFWLPEIFWPKCNKNSYNFYQSWMIFKCKKTECNFSIFFFFFVIKYRVIETSRRNNGIFRVEYIHYRSVLRTEGRIPYTTP